MDVSIIIVNYKTSDLIADCVRSIINKTLDIEFEVIILDNDSEPDFKEIISVEIPYEFKHLFQFVPLKENMGFGRANNEGLKYSHGRNIFFLNPDTVLINNAVKILSDFLDNNRKVGACGANLLDENMAPAKSFWRFLPGVFFEIDNILHNIPQKILYKNNRIHNFTGKPMKVAMISGADLMVKREVLEKTGYFCEDYFMYYDETDLCARIKKMGFDLYSVPEALIQHLEGQSLAGDVNWEDERRPLIYEDSKKIYYTRNLNSCQRAVAYFLYRIFLDSRILLIKNPKKKNYYRFRRKCFMGN